MKAKDGPNPQYRSDKGKGLLLRVSNGTKTKQYIDRDMNLVHHPKHNIHKNNNKIPTQGKKLVRRIELSWAFAVWFQVQILLLSFSSFTFVNPSNVLYGCWDQCHGTSIPSLDIFKQTTITEHISRYSLDVHRRRL